MLSARIILSGPTYFAHIIRRYAALAKQALNTYSVLLLITDGVLNDVQETIDAICEASETPLSIIIVGVGDAGFSTMRVLDADTTPLITSRGVVCHRDIVQFVPFKEISELEILHCWPRKHWKRCQVNSFNISNPETFLPLPPMVMSEDEIATNPVSGCIVPPPHASAPSSQVTQAATF